MNNIKEFIREEIELILEERSVSSIVENMCDLIENEINKTVNTGIKYSSYPFTYKKDGIMKISNVGIGYFLLDNINEIKEVDVTIYNFDTKDDLNIFIMYTQYFECGYDYKNNILNLSCAAVENKIYHPLLRRLLSHELKHVYRVLYFNFNPSELYLRVSSLINTINKNDINYKIAYLIYWLYNDEIYANCQALYNDCVSKKLYSKDGILNFSDIYNEFNIIKEWYSEIKGHEDKYKSKLFLGISYQKILNYIQKQIRYCQKKFDRVISYIIDKNTMNENLNIKGDLPIIRM